MATETDQVSLESTGWTFPVGLYPSSGTVTVSTLDEANVTATSADRHLQTVQGAFAVVEVAEGVSEALTLSNQNRFELTELPAAFKTVFANVNVPVGLIVHASSTFGVNQVAAPKKRLSNARFFQDAFLSLATTAGGAAAGIRFGIIPAFLLGSLGLSVSLWINHRSSHQGR
jgi:hypothetical protein